MARSLGARRRALRRAYLHGATTSGVLAVELGGGGQQPWPPAGDIELGLSLTRDHAFILGLRHRVVDGHDRRDLGLLAPRAGWVAVTGRYRAVLAVLADLMENLFLTAAWIGVGDRGRKPGHRRRGVDPQVRPWWSRPPAWPSPDGFWPQGACSAVGRLPRPARRVSATGER